MKILTVFLIVVLFGVDVATAQWQQGNQSPSETLDRKSSKGFGGHLLVVEDLAAFIEEWKKPQTPNINPVKEALRGARLGAFVLFAGCKTDAEGKCNAEVDYVVYKPDGSVFSERKAQPLWKEEAPPPGNIQLSAALLSIRTEAQDPAGEYVVKAKVTDLNAKVSLELETRFQLK